MPPSFLDLGVAPVLVDELAHGGITDPSPVQAATIPDALAGRDVCGRAPTGSGKTLAYGLPLLQRTRLSRQRPRSLVLVPTRELANQIADDLAPLAEASGLWITAIYGGVSMNRQIQALREGVDIVIATPGRLNDLLERRELSVAHVEVVVLDEADQMADMGFLPQVERILRQIEGDPQTLLFSATLDGAVGKLVRTYLKDPVHHTVDAAPEAPGRLEQRFIGVGPGDKVAVAAQVCAGVSRALVFVRTTYGADRVVKQLGREGLPASAIHGRQSQNKRERTLGAFADGSVAVLVATNVAARGIHVDHVDVVLHFDPPEDPKTYLHRSGRTARAGEGGLVVTLVLPEEERGIAQIQRATGLDVAVMPMRPGDPRLGDLSNWEPPVRAAESAREGVPTAARPGRRGASSAPSSGRRVPVRARGRGR
ncbi:MAG: DEAD/DEAH box helicase [Dehalococcoidia bacterium]|nr:DEAD/DEAH box helicase [Dehalococcoidia bacterium]